MSAVLNQFLYSLRIGLRRPAEIPRQERRRRWFPRLRDVAPRTVFAKEQGAVDR